MTAPEAPNPTSVQERPEDTAYGKAQADPVAALVLEALHAQDARTYNGQSGDTGTLALETAAMIRQHLDTDLGELRRTDELKTEALRLALMGLERTVSNTQAPAVGVWIRSSQLAGGIRWWLAEQDVELPADIESDS